MVYGEDEQETRTGFYDKRALCQVVGFIPAPPRRYRDEGTRC
jgi:hypothetical protein